jgi:hypothetical protein
MVYLDTSPAENRSVTFAITRIYKSVALDSSYSRVGVITNPSPLRERDTAFTARTIPWIQLA